MQPIDREPLRSYSVTSEPHSRWKDALLVSCFVLFIYIFVRTGGFFMPPKPTPTLAVPPKAIAQTFWTATPAPTQIVLTPTPTPVVPKFLYQNPDIRGTVIEIYSLNGKVTGAYVRGKLEADTRLAQSFVKFTDKTQLYRKNAEDYLLGGLADLAKGDTVEIVFTIPISQSASDQAVADEIVILK